MQLIRGLAGIAVVVLASCEGGPGTGGVATPSPQPFAAKARQLVSDLAAGNFAAVEAEFDATMRLAQPAAVLSNNWRTYEELLGAFVSQGTSSSVSLGALDVERVPVTMAGGPGEVRVTFHPDRTVAGLYFLKAGAPPP